MTHNLADLPSLFEDEMLDTVGSIVEVCSDPDASELKVVLRIRGFEDFDERRKIVCRDALRWQLTEDTIYWFRVLEEHPALLPFSDEQGDLYFTGAPRDPARTADAIRAVSADLAGSYFNFEAAINSERGGLAALLDEGYGKVASGPMTLMRAFQEVLESAGARTSLLGIGPPKVYSELDMKWVPVSGVMSLLDLGSSWIVAQSFDCGPA